LLIGFSLKSPFIMIFLLFVCFRGKMRRYWVKIEQRFLIIQVSREFKWDEHDFNF